MYWDYLEGGGGEERTVRGNEAAWSDYWLLPRVLRGVGEVSVSRRVLGRDVAAPLIVAPMAYHKLFHPDGEAGTAAAAADVGILNIVPMRGSTSLEDVAEAGAERGSWLQMYVHPDRAYTESIVRRAVDAGYSALVVTVDRPVRALRPRDSRNGFALPVGMDLPNNPPPELLERQDNPYYIPHDAGLTFEVIEWLSEVSGLPVIPKGVLHPEDARACVARGAPAVIVSNHGGRQADTVVPTAWMLPAVAAAVGGDAEVYVDGGIRSGLDALKALALGARAVLVGRPVLWGLAAQGREGATKVLRIYKEELERGVAQMGAAGLDALDSDVVYRPAGAHERGGP